MLFNTTQTQPKPYIAYNKQFSFLFIFHAINPLNQGIYLRFLLSSGADFIEFVKLRKTNDNFVQDDEPIDEANYLKAKEFAVNQLKVIDTFFNDNPIFSYEK